ncbi:unnamed protein product, partial [Prorocentrum cordatum]
NGPRLGGRGHAGEGAGGIPRRGGGPAVRRVRALCRAPAAQRGQRQVHVGAGFLFHIGVFSRAEGALPLGAAYAEGSWFPGYTWRMGHCVSCGAHLGWSYQGAGDIPAPANGAAPPALWGL